MPALLIDQQVSLQPYNTLAVAVVTRWFARVTSIAELHQALVFCQQQQCPLLVLGGGSNVLLADDFPGLCIVMNIMGRSIEKETEDSVFLSLAAGENWHDTVMYCVDKHYYGIENLALIPGSVGAAPIQNIGAYGVELEQCFCYLEAVDIASGKLLTFNNSQCQFAYRDSVFKHSLQDQVVITRVVLRLAKTAQWTLDYPALQTQLATVAASELTAAQLVNAVVTLRQAKLPNPDDIPNAGSFFKNPIVSSACYFALRQQYPDIVAFLQGDNSYKLAAAWLLDHAGWRGKMLDGIAMHKQQALVLTNPQRLSGKQLLAFIETVKNDIYMRYHIHLEPEPRIISL